MLNYLSHLIRKHGFDLQGHFPFSKTGSGFAIGMGPGVLSLLILFEIKRKKKREWSKHTYAPDTQSSPFTHSPLFTCHSKVVQHKSENLCVLRH